MRQNPLVFFYYSHFSASSTFSILYDVVRLTKTQLNGKLRRRYV